MKFYYCIKKKLDKSQDGCPKTLLTNIHENRYKQIIFFEGIIGNPFHQGEVLDLWVLDRFMSSCNLLEYIDLLISCGKFFIVLMLYHWSLNKM